MMSKMKYVLFLVIFLASTENSYAKTNHSLFSFKYSTSNLEQPFVGADSTAIQLKSSKRAVNIALLTTVGSIVVLPLAPLGVIVGPSAGSIYAGEYGDALTGSLSRLGSASLVGLGVFYMLDDQSTAGNVMIWTGVGTFIYSVVKHIWFLGPRNVDKYNMNQKKKPKLAIAPIIEPAFGRQSLGLSLSLKF